MWVDAEYLENKITAKSVQALGLSGPVFVQAEMEARTSVISAMQFAGYPIPGDTLEEGTVATSFLRKLVSAVLIRDAWQNRKGIRLPFDPNGTITEGLFLLDAVWNKRLPIPGMEPLAKSGYGSAQASPTFGTEARNSVFGPGKLTGF